ncbi:MAG: J domain-containing protein [Lachnospiraceae bacterium]|nr:J domain-containing protein [Lachnospiraceae bacterium]
MKGNTRVNRFMLRMEMILAAPGKGLHVLLGKARRRPDVGRGVFLLCTLLLVGLGLFLLRRNTWLLLIGGTAMAVAAFFLYKPVLKGLAAFFIFLEAGTHVFAKSYDDCRRALGLNAEGKGAEADPSRRDSESGAGAEKKAASGKEGGKQADPDTRNTTAEEAKESPEEERRRREAEAQAWTKAKQKAKQEKRREQTEKKRRRMEEEAERERAKRGGPKAKTDKKPHESSAALEEAKAFFNVEIPFSEAEIKEKRNLLMKKYHPDNPGGSEEMCKKINECYSILFKYTS